MHAASDRSENVLVLNSHHQDSLPAGSTVVNQPASFYEQHKTRVWATLGVLVALCVLIGTLP